MKEILTVYSFVLHFKTSAQFLREMIVKPLHESHWSLLQNLHTLILVILFKVKLSFYISSIPNIGRGNVMDKNYIFFTMLFVRMMDVNCFYMVSILYLVILWKLLGHIMHTLILPHFSYGVRLGTSWRPLELVYICIY